jgi:hypothetical protein
MSESVIASIRGLIIRPVSNLFGISVILGSTAKVFPW